MPTTFELLVLLWSAWVVQSWLSALQLRKFLRRRVLAGQPWFPPHTPRAHVVVPVKGVDADLRDCVRGLLDQDYPDYRVIFVVQSESDPAASVLRDELGAHAGGRGRLVVAGVAGPEVGQKVHNQLAAIELLDADSADDEAWVFADADAAPSRQWLAKLVAPLGFPKVGVSTGYRWMIPEAGRGSLWTLLACQFNASAAAFLGRYFQRAWGGAMAMRAGVARAGDLRGLLRGALSDDYQVSRMTRQMGLLIRFIPQCLVPSRVALDRAGMVQFVRRQYLITRVYDPWLFLGAVAVLSLYAAGFLSALAAAVAWACTEPGSGRWLWPVGAWALSGLGNALRAHYRRRIVRHALGDAVERDLHAVLALDRWATPLWMLAHLAVVLSAGVGRTIAWRGVRYRLDAPQRVRRLEPPAPRP